MTGIEPVEYQGHESSCRSSSWPCCPTPPAWGRAPRADLHRLCRARRQGRRRRVMLHLQHLRPPGLLPGGAVPGDFLHHRRTCHDRRQDDPRGQVAAARRMEYRAVRPRSVHGRHEPLWPALEPVVELGRISGWTGRRACHPGPRPACNSPISQAGPEPPADALLRGRRGGRRAQSAHPAARSRDASGAKVLARPQGILHVAPGAAGVALPRAAACASGLHEARLGGE